jgi:hypothetical protein
MSNKMENISKELNYSPVVNNHSSIVYRFVSPQAGGNVTTGVSADVGPTEFLIAPSCWIPELSKLSFQISVPISTAATFNCVNANVLSSISRITVYDTATSNVVMDCSNFEKYASLMTSAATKYDDFVTKAGLSAVSATDVLSKEKPVEDISKTILTTNSLAGFTVAGATFTAASVSLAASNPTFARRQFYIGGASETNMIDVCIPFSALKLTALASDKIWYSPSSLVVQIYWAANQKYAFRNDSATVIGGTQVSTDVGAAITIVRPQLLLANEGNLAIVSQVINKVMSGGGIQLPIAYPTVVQTTSSGGDNQSFQYQLTRGYGNRILALITSAFNATTTNALANSHPRVITTYYNTFLNNVAIRSPNGFVGYSNGAAQASDYTIANYPYLKGSVLQNNADYIAEWEHIDGFFGNKPLHEVDQHQVDGLDVTAQASTWQWQSNVNSAGYRWFTVIVGQKTMSLTAQGVMVQ